MKSKDLIRISIESNLQYINEYLINQIYFYSSCPWSSYQLNRLSFRNSQYWSIQLIDRLMFDHASSNPHFLKTSFEKAKTTITSLSRVFLSPIADIIRVKSILSFCRPKSILYFIFQRMLISSCLCHQQTSSSLTRSSSLSLLNNIEIVSFLRALTMYRHLQVQSSGTLWIVNDICGAASMWARVYFPLFSLSLVREILQLFSEKRYETMFLLVFSSRRHLLSERRKRTNEMNVGKWLALKSNHSQ